MPENLSHASQADTGGFYTAIHRRIAERPCSTPTSNEFSSWLKREFPVPVGLAALDAGCGVHALNTRAARVHGFGEVQSIDLNPASGVTVASVLDLPFEDRRFDLVICSGVAHHTADPQRAFRELHRVLKPGGVAYVSLYTFARSPFAAIVRVWRLLARVIPFRVAHRMLGHIPAINNFVLDHAYVPVLWLYTKHEASLALAEAGLEPQQSWRSSFDTTGALAGDGLLTVFSCRRPL